jgi:hypothetical protein
VHYEAKPLSKLSPTVPMEGAAPIWRVVHPGTGLVFAKTLVLAGLANGLGVEAQRTVDAMGVDAFVVKAGAGGPFLGINRRCAWWPKASSSCARIG